MHRILVIDDDSIVRDVLESFFTGKGFSVTLAENGERGVELLDHDKFDILFVDLVMPGLGGLDVLQNASERKISTPSIVMTAFAEVKTAVEAMRLGAFDYITKPFILEELLITVNRALKLSKLKQENLMLKKQLKQKYNFHGLIGASPRMQKVYDMIEKVADTESTVLITGESGTGKEVVAKTIHFNSSRAQNSFIPLNCSAIPKDLLESELFGHEKGAFTGAVNTRIGRFELANGGTIFLDEIGELHPSLQVKLLRVLQEREFERVGGTKTVKVDVRILAATNKDLEKATQDGTFREDLFYRLNVIPLHLPPLRKRKEDIPLLIDHFMQIYCKKKKKELIKISQPIMDCFLSYRWHGNVRELENLIERVVILNDTGSVTLDDLPERFHCGRCEPLQTEAFPASAESRASLSITAGGMVLPAEGIDLNSVLNTMENGLILQALERSAGVKKKAAELLGLNRTTLLEKLKKKGIELPSQEKISS
ncbi:MAG: sigma-54-dependent Fis family transcriptional regulator [Nitrospirae bacterium]|nr:sigma-54-dependent Fis family transcriptional regulator [Nitrospirota bacterium]